MTKSLTHKETSVADTGLNTTDLRAPSGPKASPEQRVLVREDLDLAASEMGQMTRRAVDARSTRMPPGRARPRRERIARVTQRRHARRLAKGKDLPNGIFKNPVYPYPRDPLGKVITFLANVMKVFVRFILAILGGKKVGPTAQPSTQKDLRKRAEQPIEKSVKPPVEGRKLAL